VQIRATLCVWESLHLRPAGTGALLKHPVPWRGPGWPPRERHCARGVRAVRAERPRTATRD